MLGIFYKVHGYAGTGFCCRATENDLHFSESKVVLSKDMDIEQEKKFLLLVSQEENGILRKGEYVLSLIN